MKTGFRGTFVISWSQTELDGLWSAPLDTLRVGTAWTWTGEAVRVDGPTGVLPLGDAMGEADLRKRAAHSVRRLLNAVEVDTACLQAPAESGPLFDLAFNVTDGRDTWTISLIETGRDRKPLLMFMGAIPPRHTDLWVVSHNINLEARNQTTDTSGGVICFTPGTMIMTEDGARDVAALVEGDRIQTKDNGCEEILWIGSRRISGARLYAMPHLTPIRLRKGALDEGVPDAGLLVSPDHRMVLRGARAKLLFNCDEVLVTAKDLVNDHSVLIDRSVRDVTYIHLLLPRHQIVFANGVETESFHPASAAMATIGSDEKARLFERLPEINGDPQVYGSYARRVLSDSEAAILGYDGGWRTV
jgi:hypothetical protein